MTKYGFVHKLRTLNFPTLLTPLYALVHFRINGGKYRCKYLNDFHLRDNHALKCDLIVS